eukprot:9133481-Lingulodinium_polyedra.AAC.1
MPCHGCETAQGCRGCFSWRAATTLKSRISDTKSAEHTDHTQSCAAGNNIATRATHSQVRHTSTCKRAPLAQTCQRLGQHLSPAWGRPTQPTLAR